MRLRPRSRPSGRNHSSVVVNASAHSTAADGDGRIPSDMGMLASVDEQSRCERMPRCASTARTYWRIGALSGRPPPAAPQSPLAWPPPCRRWRAGSRARGRDPRRRPAGPRFVHFPVGLGADVHFFARAIWGMALTLDPPSIRPTFTADLGSARRCAFRRTAPPRGTTRAADCRHRNRPAMAARTGEGDLEAAAP